MYNSSDLTKLSRRLGSYASWAIWSYENEKDVAIINRSKAELHSDFVFIGLNISASLNNIPWSNFHGGRHDRKLKYACNDTILRGSYMTDLFKGVPEVNSNKLRHLLTQKVIDENVDLFNREMELIKLKPESQFIILGSLSAEYYHRYFRQERRNTVICHHHHSWYGISDREWVNLLWNKLGINRKFADITDKYKKAV